MKTLEELTHAHDNGFLSDEDFSKRVAELSQNTGFVDSAMQLADEALNSELANDVVDGSKSLVREALKSELAVDMATGAAAGAVIASVVPLVGTGAGAVVGAAIGAYKNFTKKP